MQTIIPHLWYDTEAKEAAEFYVDLFANGLC
ncbi:VOC family protein [Streptococcus parasuis]|nr:VOC family protein [Streptococcus parasuis]